MKGNIKIRQYMRNNVTDHVDPLTGEVNATGLAEDTFWALEPDNNGEIPESYFECAEEIAERHEIATGIRQSYCRAAGYINSIPGGSL